MLYVGMLIVRHMQIIHSLVYAINHIAFDLCQDNIKWFFPITKIAFHFYPFPTLIMHRQLESSLVEDMLRFTLHTQIIATKDLGAVSIRKTVLPGTAIPMLKIRRPDGRLIFNMEISIRR